MGSNRFENWTADDIQHGQWMAGRLLYGLLKNDIPDEKKEAIYKTLTGVYWLHNDLAPEGNRLLGGKYTDFARKLEKDYLDTMSLKDRPKVADALSGSYVMHDDPEWEGPLKDYQDAMNELVAALDDKIKNGRFASNAEANYAYLSRMLLEPYVKGESLTEEFFKNPSLLYADQVIQGKLRFTNPVPLDVKGTFTIENKDNINEADVLRALEGSGIIESISQAGKVADMTQKAINTGEVSREELLAEHEELAKRVGRTLDMSRQEFAAIKNRTQEKVFDNDWGEFTRGDRGFVWEEADVNMRIDILKAGYPVEDLESVGYIVKKINSLKDRAKDFQKKLDKESSQKNPNADKIKEYNDQITKANQLVDVLQQSYDELKKDPPLTEAKRVEKLTDLKEAAASVWKMDNPQDETDYMHIATWSLDKRINAELSHADKALLDQNASSMLTRLKAVDPLLVRSSAQFKAFKEAMVDLADFEKKMNPDSEEDIREYQRLAKNAAESGREYSQYKTRQLNGSKRGHKRSELEADRVKVVDSIVSGLNNKCIPGTDVPIIPLGQRVKTVESLKPGKIGGFMFEPVKDGLPKGYDSYIKLHTGKGAINGTEEEMKSDLKKVVAAIAIKGMDSKAAFSVDRIHRCADLVGKLYDLDSLSKEELQEALQNENSVKKLCSNQRERIYGFTKKYAGDYKGFVDAMANIYERMDGPEGKSDAYKKLFETVKEAAHMPKAQQLVKVDDKKFYDKMEQLSFSLIRYADEVADEKGVEHVNKYAMDVLAELKTDNRFRGALNRINSVPARINRERADSALFTPEPIRLADYGINRLATEEKKREVDENFRLQKLEGIKKTEMKTRHLPDKKADIRKKLDGPDTNKNTGAKEAPEPKHRPKINLPG